MRPIKLLECASGQVPRVGVLTEAGLLSGCIDFAKGIKAHKHLPTHFQQLRRAFTQLKRHSRAGLSQVVRHDVTLFAITSGYGPAQVPVFVDQADGYAIQFGLDQRLQCGLAQFTPQASPEIADIGLAKGVV